MEGTRAPPLVNRQARRDQPVGHFTHFRPSDQPLRPRAGRQTL